MNISFHKLPTAVIISSCFAIAATLLFVVNDAIIMHIALQEIRFYHFIFYGTPAYLSVPIYLIVTGRFKVKMTSSNYIVPILRGVIFIPMPFLSFWALKNVSLPEFTTLTMVAPIFSIFFSIFILKEKFNWFLAISLSFGIFGVLLVVRPGFETFNIFFLIVLLNAFLISMTTVLVNIFDKIVSSEGYFVYGGIFVHGVAVMLFVFDPMFFNFKTLLLMVSASVFVNIAIFFLVLAFQKAQNFYGSVSCLNYLQIFWSLIIGVLVFDQNVDIFMIMGAIFIVLSGILSVSAQAKQIEKISEKT